MGGLGFSDWTWTGFTEHNVGVVTQLQFFFCVSDSAPQQNTKMATVDARI
jgi:hypothetical protein